MDDYKTKDAKLNTTPSCAWSHPSLRLLLIFPLNSFAESTPYASGLHPVPPCQERPTSGLPETTPRTKQSLLTNWGRDLSAADSHKESPRSRVLDASIRTITDRWSCSCTCICICIPCTLAALFPTLPIHPVVAWNSRSEPRYVYCQGRGLGI